MLSGGIAGPGGCRDVRTETREEKIASPHRVAGGRIPGAASLAQIFGYIRVSFFLVTTAPTPLLPLRHHHLGAEPPGEGSVWCRTSSSVVAISRDGVDNFVSSAAHDAIVLDTNGGLSRLTAHSRHFCRASHLMEYLGMTPSCYAFAGEPLGLVLLAWTSMKMPPSVRPSERSSGQREEPTII